MSPVQSVEVLLAPDGEARVRAQWQALADGGLPSQARHTGNTNAPHVTVAVRREIPATCDPHLADAAAQLPLTARLGGILLFPRRDHRVVLARAVVADEALLALHARVHESLAGTQALDPRLDPGRWQPHVTLARALPSAQLPEAVTAVTAASPQEDPIVLTALRRWDGVARRAWTPG